jgi:hypothetical protein
VIVGKGETDLLFHLETARLSQKHDGRRLEGVGARKGNHSMVKSALEGGARGAPYCEVPLKGLTLEWRCEIVGRGISKQIALLFLDTLHSYTIAP